MRDIRDLLSERLHIERIMLSQTSSPGTGESQTTHYLGAISGERFLTIALVAPVAPDHRLEPEECRWLYGRNTERDFLKAGDLPIIDSRPRSQPQPTHFDGAFRVMRRMLQGCPLAGLGLVRTGSFQWDGDTFTAQYEQTEPVKARVRILGPDGQDAPDSVKAKVLADLEADPKGQRQQFTLVQSKSVVRLRRAEDTETDAPPPGSIEAAIMARQEAKEWERLRRGVRGRIVRDPQGRATSIEMESEPGCRVEFEYATSAELPPPFPQHIKTFTASALAQPGVPTGERVIHWARLSDEPLPDAAFDPRPLLKEGEFFHGVLRPDGSSIVPDREEQRRLNQLVREKYFKLREAREQERREGQGE